MITGCSADSSMSTAFPPPSGSAPQRVEMLAFHAIAFGVSSAAASLNTSKGTSSTTGPGRPVTMVFHAWRTASGTMSPRVGWNTRPHGRREVRLIVPIEFLEGAAVELAGRHVAGDREEGHGIEVRTGERDRQV